MTTREEVMLMNQKLIQMEEKIAAMDKKLDELMSRLLDPDNGIASKVNQNTAARKGLGRALWVLYGIVAGAIAKALWF
jgi:tetrahydromethanopterin S-methyltransferase subunit G